MKIKKRVGVKVEPWRTHALVRRDVEELLFRKTRTSSND